MIQPALRTMIEEGAHLGWYKPHINRFNGEWMVSYCGHASRQDQWFQTLEWARQVFGSASLDTAIHRRVGRGRP